MTTRPPVSPASGAPSVAELQTLAAREMSTAARVMHAAVILMAAAVAGIVASLWATEPDLPRRTQIAFSAVLAFALVRAWLSGRALRHRRVLAAPQRVVVALMAVGFSILWMVGTIVTYATGTIGPAAVPATGLAATMLVVSVVMLVTARTHVRRLEARRRELAALLNGSSGSSDGDTQ